MRFSLPVEMNALVYMLQQYELVILLGKFLPFLFFFLSRHGKISSLEESRIFPSRCEYIVFQKTASIRQDLNDLVQKRKKNIKIKNLKNKKFVCF